MASLNKKNGNLRGVTSYVQYEPGTDFEKVSAQGWAALKNDKPGFVIVVNDSQGLVVEVNLSESALQRILGAVYKEFPEPGISPSYFTSNVVNTCGNPDCNCHDSYTYAEVY